MKAWLVCVEPRAVFFGYATQAEMKKKFPTLKDCRMCVKWSESVLGVLGLAKIGPKPGSKITPSVKSFTIRNKIEGFGECTKEAIKQWEKGIWG